MEVNIIRNEPIKIKNTTPPKSRFPLVNSEKSISIKLRFL